MGFDLFLELALFFEELVHLVVVEGLGEFVGDSVELVEEGGFLGDTFLDALEDGFGVVEEGFLFEEAGGIAWGEFDAAVEVFVDAGEDFEEGGFACAVESEDADLGAVEVGEPDVFEDDLSVVGF